MDIRKRYFQTLLKGEGRVTEELIPQENETKQERKDKKAIQ